MGSLWSSGLGGLGLCSIHCSPASQECWIRIREFWQWSSQYWEYHQGVYLVCCCLGGCLRGGNPKFPSMPLHSNEMIIGIHSPISRFNVFIDQYKFTQLMRLDMWSVEKWSVLLVCFHLLFTCLHVCLMWPLLIRSHFLALYPNKYLIYFYCVSLCLTKGTSNHNAFALFVVIYSIF